MHFDPVQWQQLSALFDEADGLDATQLQALFERLETQRHPLRDELRRMLTAKARAATLDFLARPEPFIEPAAATLRVAGQQFGPYRLVQPLGEGGMAEVWQAEHLHGLKRPVALKLPHAVPMGSHTRAQWQERFARERDILARLRHPYIAGLLDAGTTADGQSWLALEYVDGVPLTDWCDRERLDIRARVQLCRQVMLGVAHAHAQLVIHRDLKPTNILVTEVPSPIGGEPPVAEVRLLDFGIAKLLPSRSHDAEETEFTRQSGRLLTPEYASPEQILAQPLGAASDVYALGVLLYELLVGQRPYELRHGTAIDLERSILDIEPRAPSCREPGAGALEARGMSLAAWRQALRPELDAIVMKALAKRPEQRYSSVDAMLADVDRWLAGEAVLARRPTRWQHARKFIGRHRVGVTLGGLSMAAMAVLTASAVVLGLQARAESERATAARKYVFDIFRFATPGQATEEFTAAQLLDWGARHARDALAGQPALQSDVLGDIGASQLFRGEFAPAADSLATAANLALSQGDRSEWAEKLLLAGEAALRAGDTVLARKHLARLTALDEARLPSVARVHLRELLGNLAHDEGDLPNARRWLLQAVAQSERLFGLNSAEHLTALLSLADLSLASRQLDQAGDDLRQARQAFDSLHDQTPALRIRLARYEGTLAYYRADFETVAALAGAAAAGCESMYGEEVGPCVALQQLVAQAALARDDAATLQTLLPALTRHATFDGSAESASQLTTVARASAASGAPLARLSLMDGELKRLSAETGANLEEWPAIAAVARAEIALRTGAPAKADLAPHRSDSALTRAWRARLAAIRDARLAHYQQALVAAEEAIRLTASFYGPANPKVAFAEANRALVLGMLGRRQEANELWQTIRPRLEATLGPSAPAYMRAVAAFGRAGDGPTMAAAMFY